MTKPNSTDIVFVIDRSGSMSTIASAMNSGFNELIDKQRKLTGVCNVTLVQFDDPDKYEVVYEARPIAEVGTYQLEPRGMTALYDAIGRTIIKTGNRLAAMSESDRPSQVLFVIITDGLENCSVEYTGEEGRKTVFGLIEHQREKYGWEFIFLGANQDSVSTAKSLGISASNAVTFNPTKGGTEALLTGLSRGIASYRTSNVKRMDHIYDQDAYDAAVGIASGPAINGGHTKRSK